MIASDGEARRSLVMSRHPRLPSPGIGSEREYEPKEYWGELLGERPRLREVAYPGLPESFNRIIYSAMARAVTSIVATEGLLPRLPQAAILDVGSGSGAWVDFWRRLGARNIRGVDLAPGAVKALRHRYPDYEFYEADISSEALPFSRTFDVISVMSVLLHITDDERFETAVRNLSALLSRDGTLVVMDPVIMKKWWGPPFDERAHSKARPLGHWHEVLGRNGLKIRNLVPVTALLANPADTHRAISFRALSVYWHALSVLLDERERVGAAVGRLLYLLDGLLLQFVRSGPSTKVLIARHED